MSANQKPGSPPLNQGQPEVTTAPAPTDSAARRSAVFSNFMSSPEAWGNSPNPNALSRFLEAIRALTSSEAADYIGELETISGRHPNGLVRAAAYRRVVEIYRFIGHAPKFDLDAEDVVGRAFAILGRDVKSREDVLAQIQDDRHIVEFAQALWVVVGQNAQMVVMLYANEVFPPDLPMARVHELVAHAIDILTPAQVAELTQELVSIRWNDTHDEVWAAAARRLSQNKID